MRIQDKMTRALATWCIVLSMSAVASADKVWVEPLRPTSMQGNWYPRAIETHFGTVIQFDAEQLRLRPSGDEPELSFSAARVLWVESSQASDQEAEAMRLFAQGAYSSSLLKLPAILGARPAVWRQQWLTMMASVSASRSGRADIALELVSQLDQRPLPPLAIAWLPVAWTSRSLPADLTDAAKARLSDPSPLVRLVAASWLLSSPQRTEGLAILKQLETRPRVEIARFARVVSWRVASPPEVIASRDDWQAAIDSLPMVWQTGPLTLLSDKLRSANQLDAANRLRWSLELTPIHPHFDWVPATLAAER